MARTTFPTSTVTLKQLLGNGIRYVVPPFQRDYSWTQDQWEDLWQDIETIVAEDKDDVHYMGYLVLQTQDNKIFSVIDGQQRLTTFSILTMAVLKSLQNLIDADIEADRNQIRMNNLRNSYIGYLDPVTLVSRPKLTLNRRNDAYYQNYIVPLTKLPRSHQSSDRRLQNAFHFFCGKVTARFASDQKGSSHAKFLDDLTDRLFFTVITVNDELNAFTVFETLNARGVKLSPTDLLKNYLFSVVHRDNPHRSETETLERRWEEINGKLGQEDFPDFLRVHWNSRNARVRESGLFKIIREKTPDKGAVFALLRNMDEDIDAFAVLTGDEEGNWDQYQERWVRTLRLFNVRQPFALLLAARRVFSEIDFTRLLHFCVIISFRYNIILNGATGDQETVYNGLALDISMGKISTADEAVKSLKRIYPSDTEFKAAFSKKSFNLNSAQGKRMIRYALFELEAAAGNSMDRDSQRLSVEHVLPQNPGENWPQFSYDSAKEMVNRIGNCAILETPLNRTVGNLDFEAKKAVYSQSAIASMLKIAEDNFDWDAARIDNRQRQMAKLAVSVWRIPQFL